VTERNGDATDTVADCADTDTVGDCADVDADNAGTDMLNAAPLPPFVCLTVPLYCVPPRTG
jgi:hypothetical protein